MCPKKSKKATNAPKARPKPLRAALLFCLCLFAGCGPRTPPPQRPDGTRLLFAHLHDYGWMDRNGSGQPVDPKPEPERAALLRELPRLAPDVLVLRGIGGEAALNDLRAALGTTPHHFYVPGPTPFEGLGFLSRLPFTHTRELSAQAYRIRDRAYVPNIGSVKISLSDTRNLHLWNARLPPPEADYERRRNEARLLAQALRPLLAEGQDVLLSLHCREALDSPMIRMIEETGLQRLAPADERGDRWTHRDPDGVIHRQDQWLFASPALAERLADSPPVVLDTPDIRRAGPYRHHLLRLP